MNKLQESFIELEPREKLYFTVKEITQNLKSVIERNFNILWIEGEIANLRYSQNGNVYFNLIEEEASLKAIIFSSQKNLLITPYLKNGLKVLCFGRLNFYPRYGECYFIVKRLEPLGKGLLALKKEELIKKYKSFFDPNRKKALPPYPKKVAVITSLFGAALRDFLKITYNRWDVEILVYPVRVQGEGAEKEIVQAIKDINLYFKDVEVIVITRGGGSFEDLAPFYTEDIILGIKESKIPVVSAVGHEIDYTICDLIADKRCPTPTAAAEEVIPDKEEVYNKLNFYKKKYQQLLEFFLSKKERRIFELKLKLESKNPFRVIHQIETQLKEYLHQLQFKMERFLSYKESLLLSYQDRLKKSHPAERIRLEEEKLKYLKNRLHLVFEHFLESKEKRIEALSQVLNSLSPLNILQKGYSIVKSYPEGKIIKKAKELKEGDILEIKFYEGKILVEVKEIKE